MSRILSRNLNSRLGMFIILLSVVSPLAALGDDEDLVVYDEFDTQHRSSATVNSTTGKLSVAGDAQASGDLTVNGTGTSAMAGGVMVNKDGTFNADKGANNFIVYRNNAETDNSAQEVLFLINVAPEEEEEEAENSIEMWGTAQSYWKSEHWAAGETGGDGLRVGAEFYPVSLERHKEIKETEFGANGQSDKITWLEPFTVDEATHWRLNAAAKFYGIIELYKSPLYFKQYNHEAVTNYSRADFKLDIQDGHFVINPDTNQPTPIHYASDDPLYGNGTSNVRTDKFIGEGLKDKEIISQQFYVGSLRSGGPGTAAVFTVMADGDHVGSWEIELANGETAYYNRMTDETSLSAPGQIIFSTVPAGSYQLPRAGVTIKQDGRVALGYEVQDKSVGEIGVQYYGLKNPLDRLHVHANNPYYDETIGDYSFAHDEEEFDDTSAIRFTNHDTGFQGPEGHETEVGFRVGLNPAKEAFLWQFENAPVIFATNNVERMRIGDDGDVTLSGNVGMASGKTVDGVDVSALNGSVSALSSDFADFMASVIAFEAAPISLSGSGSYLTLSGGALTKSLVNLASGSHVTGTLPIGSGGTGQTSFTEGSVVFAGSSGGILAENASKLFWDDEVGALGVGTDTNPSWFSAVTQLHVRNPDAEIAGESSVSVSGMRVTNALSGETFTDGAALLLVSSELEEIQTHEAVLINFEEGPLTLQTGGTGEGAGLLKLTPGSNLLLGYNLTSAGTDATNTIVIEAGTPPSDNPAGAGQIYCEEIEDVATLMVLDESGNESIISPHSRRLLPESVTEVELPWTYYSKNAYVGVEQNVDMAGVVKAVEELSGKQFIYTRPLPEQELRGWYDNQEKEKVRVESARRKEAMKAEIEIAREDAIEQVALTAKVTTTVEKTEYKLDTATGNLVAVTRQVPVQQEIPTGQTGYKLKAGVRLDENTGKLYRHKTAEEVEIELYEIKAPPAWMAQRLASAHQ